MPDLFIIICKISQCTPQCPTTKANKRREGRGKDPCLLATGMSYVIIQGAQPPACSQIWPAKPCHLTHRSLYGLGNLASGECTVTPPSLPNFQALCNQVGLTCYHMGDQAPAPGQACWPDLARGQTRHYPSGPQDETVEHHCCNRCMGLVLSYWNVFMQGVVKCRFL